MIITSNLLMFVALAGPVATVGVGAILVTRRRGMTARTFADTAFKPPPTDDRHGIGHITTIEEAERHLGLIYKRLRAYLRDPYDFEGSRIKDEAGFEQCLDLAASLNIRIGDLGGAVTPPGGEERDEVRQQILEGLVGRGYRQRR